MDDQKKVIIVDGKKYAVWESTTNDYDVVTMECAPVTYECPKCGCVTALDDPFKKHSNTNKSEFVRMADGTHLCRDCAEGDSYTEACSDNCGVFHIMKDGHGFYNKFNEWFCDDCMTWQDDYKKGQKEEFLEIMSECFQDSKNA